jgi:hypothetical protein
MSCRADFCPNSQIVQGSPTMPIYLINAHADVEKTAPLERKIRGFLPNVIKSKNLETITREITSSDGELMHVIFLAQRL